jgi:hypothetical protein
MQYDDMTVVVVRAVERVGAKHAWVTGLAELSAS